MFGENKPLFGWIQICSHFLTQNIQANLTHSYGQIWFLLSKCFFFLPFSVLCFKKKKHTKLEQNYYGILNKRFNESWQIHTILWRLLQSTAVFQPNLCEMSLWCFLVSGWGVQKKRQMKSSKHDKKERKEERNWQIVRVGLLSKLMS